MNGIIELSSSIKFIMISKKFSHNYEDLFFWSNSNLAPSKFTLDTIAAKSLIKGENFFYQITRFQNKIKICFLLKNNLLYIVGSEEKIQFQILEAFIEELITEFSIFYKKQLEEHKGAFVNTYEAFSKDVLNLLQTIKNKVTIVRVKCDACNEFLSLYINSLLFRFAGSGFNVHS